MKRATLDEEKERYIYVYTYVYDVHKCAHVTHTKLIHRDMHEKCNTERQGLL